MKSEFFDLSALLYVYRPSCRLRPRIHRNAHLWMLNFPRIVFRTYYKDANIFTVVDIVTWDFAFMYLLGWRNVVKFNVLRPKIDSLFKFKNDSTNSLCFHFKTQYLVLKMIYLIKYIITQKSTYTKF